MQEKFAISSADLGKRIAFLREKQGVTLSKLGGGKASTAKSWEENKAPRREKWSGVAETLGLSEVFIFMGRPEEPADYAFVEKYRNEIAESDEWLRSKRVNVRSFPAFDDSAASRIPIDEGHRRHVQIREGFQPPAPTPTPQDCLKHLEEYLRRAEREPGGLGYAYRLLLKDFPLDEFDSPKK